MKKSIFRDFNYKYFSFYQPRTLKLLSKLMKKKFLIYMFSIERHLFTV